MYETFYGFKEKPFNLTPDPDFLYLSPTHQKAMTFLTYGLELREAFIQITGEIGAGKTTLVRHLLRHLDPRVRVAYLVNPRGTFRQLLRLILDELDIAPLSEALSREELLHRFRQYVEDQASKGHPAVLIFDEAQNLDTSVLEEIRMLSNFETEKAKLLQIILVGQPELRQRLSRPDMEQLHQRIAVRCHLDPLDQDETRHYIEHRLHVAGAEDGTITFVPEAIELIHQYSRGIPRLINVACNALLLAGFVDERHQFDAAAVGAAIAEVEDQVAPLPSPAPSSPEAPAPSPEPPAEEVRFEGPPEGPPSEPGPDELPADSAAEVEPAPTPEAEAPTPEADAAAPEPELTATAVSDLDAELELPVRPEPESDTPPAEEGLAEPEPPEMESPALVPTAPLEPESDTAPAEGGPQPEPIEAESPALAPTAPLEPESDTPPAEQGPQLEPIEVASPAPPSTPGMELGPAEPEPAKSQLAEPEPPKPEPGPRPTRRERPPRDWKKIRRRSVIGGLILLGLGLQALLVHLLIRWFSPG